MSDPTPTPPDLDVVTGRIASIEQWIAAREAERAQRAAATPRANPPVIIGPFDNVPAPGSPIRSNWPQEISHYVLDNVVQVAGDTMTGTLYGTHASYTGNVITGSAGDGTGNVYVGHTSANPVAVGCELRANGAILSAIQTVGWANMSLNKDGASDVGGQPYVSFTRDPDSKVTGSITLMNSTQVAYNTTSDKRLKTLVAVLDPAAALDRVLAVEPVRFTWTAYPEDGEQVGMFAQDLAEVAPEAVTAGTGEPDEPGFVPWQVDPAKLVPTLIAAVQALAGRLAQLEAAR